MTLPPLTLQLHLVLVLPLSDPFFHDPLAFVIHQARGAKIYAEYIGGAYTCDAHHMTEPHPDGR